MFMINKYLNLNYLIWTKHDAELFHFFSSSAFRVKMTENRISPRTPLPDQLLSLAMPVTHTQPQGSCLALGLTSSASWSARRCISSSSLRISASSAILAVGVFVEAADQGVVLSCLRAWKTAKRERNGVVRLPEAPRCA